MPDRAVHIMKTGIEAKLKLPTLCRTLVDVGRRPEEVPHCACISQKGTKLSAKAKNQQVHFKS